MNKLLKIKEFINSLPADVVNESGKFTTLSVGGTIENSSNAGNCMNPGDCDYSTNDGACTNMSQCYFSRNGSDGSGNSCRNPTRPSNPNICGGSNIGGITECH